MSFTDMDAWHFRCCLPHQTRSQEWLLEILHQLWNYGMDFRSFQYGNRAPLTWEELLASTGEVSGWTSGTFTGTLYYERQLAKTDPSKRNTTSFDALVQEATAEVRRARTTFTLLHEQRGISEADMLGLSFPS